MTEQEYKAKQNQLKQIRKNMTDLGHEETALIRQMAQYKFNKHIKDRYFYSEEFEVWIKPIKLNGEKVICVTVDSDLDPYKDIKDYHVEEDYYWVDDFTNLKEISKNTFTTGVENIINEVKKIIYK